MEKVVYNKILALLFISHVQLTYAADAFITLNKPIEEQNISMIINNNSSAEAYTEETVMDGLNCRFVPTGKYGYFRVDDEIIPYTENNLILEITFLDEGNGFFYYQYNALSGSYQKLTIKKTNSNKWITLKVNITDAAFNNAQNNNADFRISGGTYIRYIGITKGVLIPDNETVPNTNGSSYSEFKGKSVAGYQAWFRASDNNENWVHWPKATSNKPAPGNSSFEVYPYMEDYPEEKRMSTDFADLGNGETSTLFNSPDVIDVHFSWMKQYGIDGAALQRFIGDNPYPIIDSEEAIPVKVKQAAEINQKIFYICYDISSGQDEEKWVESIKFDWVFNIEQTYALTSSPAYATVNNKPVVQIWGTGFTSRVGTANKTIELINFLKGRGCYVIGGVPTTWRSQTGGSKPDFLDAYKTYDMISPWTPGRYKNISAINDHTTNFWQPDKTFCDNNNIDYMPVIFPGFAWSTWHYGDPNSTPRENGQFLWQQVLNCKNIGIKQLYFAMFDEYDEGTAIMKGASDWSQIPTNQYFLTLSADGYWLSEDFYLRLAGASTEAIKSSSPIPNTIPIDHSSGPVFYRNSFEKREHSYQESENGEFIKDIFNLDPCFKNPLQITKENITNSKCIINKNAEQSHSGEYHVLFNGNPNSLINAVYSYKIADVKVKVEEGMQISYWKKTINHLGRYANLDLEFKSGKKLSELSDFKNNYGKDMKASNGIGIVNGGWDHIQCLIGKGELIGDEIIHIIVSYDRAYDNSTFEALFDDILISTELPIYNTDTGIDDVKSYCRIYTSNKQIYFDECNHNSIVSICNLSGQVIYQTKLTDNYIVNPGLSGLYIIVLKSNNNQYAKKIVL